jgi:hypothetical protein
MHSRAFMATSLAIALAGLVLAGCETPRMGETAAPQPAPAPDLPASIRAEEIIGRWGYASYHRPDDRARTENAARGQCGKPFVISRGPNGGPMMHVADQNQQQELRLRGGPGGKNFMSPTGETGSDIEIVEFNGRVLVTRYVDPEVHGRYGYSVYVKCGPRA